MHARRVATVWCVLALAGSTGPSLAAAQPAAEQEAVETDGAPGAPGEGDRAEPTSAEAAREPTEPSAPVPPAPAPAPVSPAPPAPPAPAPSIPIRASGILWGAVIVTNGVQSFSFADAVAVTAAVNPALPGNLDAPNLTFQVQQTRIGVILGDGAQLRGQIEVDFVHFESSSPTVQAYPRLRIALAEWIPAEGHRLFLGQTWDIFSPLNAHTINLVGNMFWAGNSGFMRHQLGWEGTFGDAKLALAAGFQGANTGPTFNNLEQSMTPTGAARFTYRLGSNGSIGASAIATALRFTATDPMTMMALEERRLALGGNLFADLTFGPLSLRLEGYIAQNLANMGALTLGMGRFGSDVADAGGYVSTRLTLEQHALTATFGIAGVLTAASLVPGYVVGTGPTDPSRLDGARGPGVEWNVTGHVGYVFTPLPGLQLMLEPYLYVTRHRLDAADVGRVSPERIALGVQVGSMFTF